MATLLPTSAQKAAETSPRNANEAQIARARAGMASADKLWSQPRQTQKAEAPAAPARTSHVSAPGRTTMKTAEPTIARKADPLAALPLRVKTIAEPLADGQKSFLAMIYERHSATKEAISFTKAEAGHVMGLPDDAAGRTVDALVGAGLISPRFNVLGGVAGYVPAITE